MAVVAFDTLATVKSLKAAGFTEAQAEVVTRAVAGSGEPDLSGLATKADVASLATKAELAEVKFDILKWMFGAIGLQTLVILGAVVAFIRTIVR